MGLAEGPEATSGYGREEAGTKAQRQKQGMDYCRMKKVAWATGAPVIGTRSESMEDL